jgi:Glycosyl transferase family 2
VSELRVLLGVASGGHPTQPFIASLSKLKLPANFAPLKRSVAVGNYIPGQRELIMSDAVDEGFDYLFFVDDDVVLPEDSLAKLVATAEADPLTAVVGGLYYSRDSLRPIAVAEWDSSDTSTAHIPAFTSMSTDPVDGIGFGCALLRVSVAKQLGAPFFAAHIYIERQARRVRQCDEDYLYCERVRKSGHVVRLDARVRCLHYDRESDSTAPVSWESDAVTSAPRMIVLEDGVTRLVPLDARVPRVVERHAPADVTYISVD